ncbi:MAG: HAMP domain-containing sensor histidine kinase [Phycisphaerales bacterium]
MSATPDDARRQNDKKLGTTRSAPPPGGATNPCGGPYAADQLTVLAHDLSGMIDGSMRWLSLAADTLPEDSGAAFERVERARAQIATVRDTLGRMAGLVDGAMKNGAVPIGSPLLGENQRVSIGEAIDHAADVVRPLAFESNVALELCIDQQSGRAPSGMLYSAILNGMRNAIEAIGRAPTRDNTTCGTVTVTSSIDDRGMLVVEIADDGPGVDDPERAFQHGYSTKNPGSGLGLGLSRQLVEQAGGSITLGRGPNGTGSVLRIEAPVPACDNRLIGGTGEDVDESCEAE